MHRPVHTPACMWAQANCVARLAPLAAGFCGHRAALLEAVGLSARVTQNTDAAVAWGCAAAAVLEGLLLGGTALESVLAVVRELRDPQGTPRSRRGTSRREVHACPGAG